MSEQNTTQTNSGMNPMIIGAIVVGALLIGGIAYSQLSGSNSTEDARVTEQTQEALPDMTTQTTTETAPAAETASDSPAMAADVKVVEIEGGAFYYKPNEIRVKKGEKVKVVMKSVDMMHDFVIDELGVKMPIAKSGETGTVEFTADQAGTYEFYCSVGQHRAQGQVGKLIVEE